MRKLAATALIAIAACQGTPPGAIEAVKPSILVQPSSEWNTPTDANSTQVKADFWKSFDSPQLNAIIGEGLAASPTLAISARRVATAAASLAATAGADLPQIQASLGATRSRFNYVGLPVPGGTGVLVSQTSSFGLSLGASWELDLWGRLASAERGAAANLDAASLDLVAAHQSLAAQIAKACFAMAEAHAGHTLKHEALINSQAQLNHARRRMASGLGQPEDTLVAEAGVAQARADETAAFRREALLGPPLAVLIGRSAGRGALFLETELDTLMAELKARPLGALPAAGVPADLLARRPDLAALEARLNVAQAGAEVARAALFPQISLTTSVGTSGSELQNLLDGNFQVWSLGANILAPLFNGGRLRAMEDRAIADRDAALLAFAQAALVAFAEVDSSLTNEGHLMHQLDALDIWHEKLAQNERLLESRNHRGSTPAAAVLAARSARINADVARLAIFRERLVNRIDLFLALGGGFEVQP